MIPSPSTAGTMWRGLSRLAVVLMIAWNLFVLWFSLTSINETRARALSNYLAVLSDCVKSRPSRDCLAAYEKSIQGYSQWDEIKKQFKPVDIALVELLPLIAIGVPCGFLWGIRATVLWVLRGFGLRFVKPSEAGESVALRERLHGIGRWFLTTRNMLPLSVGMVALAVSCYFFVSLPALNRERLQFEKDSAAAAKAERDNKETAEARAAQERELSLQMCASETDKTYWSYVKLNGTAIPEKPTRSPNVIGSTIPRCNDQAERGSVGSHFTPKSTLKEP